MSRHRWILVCCAALALSACGGGGATGVLGAGPDADSSTLTNNERIQQVLEGCAASSTDELLALLEQLTPFLDPDAIATTPGFQITSINPLAGTLDWALDLENDGTVDATGTAGFRTPADTPYFPLSFLTLLGDVANLPGLIAGLPDGTIFRTSFTMTRVVTTTGSVDVVFANPDGTNATPASSSGTATVTQPDCTARFTWTDVAVPDLQSPTLTYPNTVVTMQIDTAQDTITGTVAFNGTSVATIDATLQGTGTTQQFLFDLETGQLTPVI